MKIGTEEGEACAREGCIGKIEVPKVDNCSCHISPPCWECQNSKLTCTECGFEVENEQ